MEEAKNFLESMRLVITAYNSALQRVCKHYELSILEAKIVIFLFNNPQLNTAGNIVKSSMLSKGNVSQAVEQLVKKGLLERRPDAEDRRRIYLVLQPSAEPIIDTIRCEWNHFYQCLYADVTDEEKESGENLRKKLIRNAKIYLEKTGRSEAKK